MTPDLHVTMEEVPAVLQSYHLQQVHMKQSENSIYIQAVAASSNGHGNKTVRTSITVKTMI